MKWLILVTALATWSYAAEEPHSTAAGETEHLNYPHPTLPESHLRWPGVTLIVIALMFFSAMIIGPIVRAEQPQEVPPAHSHDEPPGASGHHGTGGIVQPGPEHDHNHGASHH